MLIPIELLIRFLICVLVLTLLLLFEEGSRFVRLLSWFALRYGFIIIEVPLVNWLILDSFGVLGIHHSLRLCS